MASVFDPSPTYVALQRKRNLTEALMEGVEAMRDLARKRIYMWPGSGEMRTVQIGDEEPNVSGTGYESLTIGSGGGTVTKYELRIRESYLRNYWKAGVEGISALPFRRPATIEGWDPLLQGAYEDDRLVAPGWAHNIDRAGRTWRQFLQDSYLHATAHGMDWVLVDLPREGGVGSVAEVRERGYRPYWSEIRASQVLDAVVDTSRGYPRLEILRYKRIKSKRDETLPWQPADEGAEEVKVYYAGDLSAPAGSDDAMVHVETYQDDDTFTVDVVKPIVGELRDIPAVPIYSHAGYIRPYVAGPALYDLAEAQAAHWRKQSRHDWRTKAIATAILFQSGVDYDSAQVKGGNAVDEAGLIWSADPQSKAEMVETSGAALAALREDLDTLSLHIQDGTQAASMTEPRGTRSVLEVGISEMRANSQTEADVILLEASAQRLFELTAILGGTSALGTVDIPHDVGLPSGSPERIKEMLVEGVITPAGALPALKTAGWFPDDWDVDAEVERLQRRDGGGT